MLGTRLLIVTSNCVQAYSRSLNRALFQELVLPPLIFLPSKLKRSFPPLSEGTHPERS